MHLPKYSLRTGDRFGWEEEARLAAIIRLQDAGVEAAPVRNILLGSDDAELGGKDGQAIAFDGVKSGRHLREPEYFRDRKTGGL